MRDEEYASKLVAEALACFEELRRDWADFGQRMRNSRPSKAPELRQVSMYSKYATGPSG